MRWKLTIEYDGRPFVGWQRQLIGVSVQHCVEEAIFRFDQQRVTAHAAGRTDAGVHALGQVVHAEIARAASADTVREALNFHLRPQPIVVLRAEAVAEDFHARFSCKGRAYRYRIVNRRAPLALDAGRAWHLHGRLDAAAMAEAARLLVGRHDFSSFRAAHCQAKIPALKTLDLLDVARDGEEITVIARARSFLHHQVRNMVGSLKLVGEGKWSPADLARVLDTKDRTQAGPTAPPDGLYFTEAWY